MKVPILTVFAAVALLVCFAEAAGPFDGVNVDVILNNPAMVQKHIKCLNCRGPCDRIGTELKRVIPVVMSTNCRSCSSSEKINMGKIVSHVQTNYPREWQELSNGMRSGRRC